VEAMGKVSAEDKLYIQTLHEQGLGYRVIAAKYPQKQWNVNMVKAICKRVDKTGSAVIRKPGSSRPKTVRTLQNIKNVSKMICSQKNEPGTSKSTRKIDEELNIHRSSVQRIVKCDIYLSAFRHIPAQFISEATKQKRHRRCQKLIRRLPLAKANAVFFTDEKTFI